MLPLQGFWNCIIYIITTQQACRQLWFQLTGRIPPPKRRNTTNYGKIQINEGASSINSHV